jgi:hypothetical protein
LGAIPGGFGKARDNSVPRVIIGGGIGDECGHGQMSAIGQSDNPTRIAVMEAFRCARR